VTQNFQGGRLHGEIEGTASFLVYSLQVVASILAARKVRVLVLTILGVGAGIEPDFALQVEPGDTSAVATVTFTMSLPNANPGYYSIALGSMGSTSYRSIPNSDQRTGEPYMVEFTASRATRTEIFRLAQKLNFFQGTFKTSQSAHGRSGSKSLTFAEGAISNQITYTSSKDPLIKHLTNVFERISSTLEFGRRLERLRANNGSELSAELKRMERQARHGKLAEFQVIAPVVQKIASDARVSKTSRRYARAILEDTHFGEGSSDTGIAEQKKCEFNTSPVASNREPGGGKR
jgi:hypothetical protein